MLAWAMQSVHPQCCHITGRGCFPQSNPDLLLHRACTLLPRSAMELLYTARSTLPLSRTLPHPYYMLFICFQRWDLESGGSVSNGIKPQWSLNHRLEQRRGCAEWGFGGGDAVVGWGFRRLGRVDSSHQGQQGCRNNAEMWGLEIQKGIGLNLLLLRRSFGANKGFPWRNSESLEDFIVCRIPAGARADQFIICFSSEIFMSVSFFTDLSVCSQICLLKLSLQCHIEMYWST